MHKRVLIPVLLALALLSGSLLPGMVRATPAAAQATGSVLLAAGLGYYSYHLGTWHIGVLNSSCGRVPGGCDATSAPGKWLTADLAAHPDTRTLAYWHRHLPLGRSASHSRKGRVCATERTWR
jgi:hypothetical protein